MSKGKKAEQLGMNPSTASGRLVKDIIWKFILETDQNICYRCHKEMTRETFSIDHKTPWLDSEDPKFTFFDMTNIGFSHFSCNVSCARNVKKKYKTKEERGKARYQLEKLSRPYCPMRRKSQYERTGK